ncbi:MAG: HAD family hydrolase [Acidimicrobiia bacterium]|jgi:phosphoglycolate phosphatase-like HAD superfamily hydrolase
MTTPGANCATPATPRVLVSFDIDGTMEFGDPPGPVSAAVARELVERGYIVGVASDWPRSAQQPLWSTHGLEPRFVGGKHRLHEVRAQFDADHYIHVGDTDIDERYARQAGFAFIHVNDLAVPVVAEAIHTEPPAR